MITYIRGILEGMEEDKVIVDVGGVGIVEALPGR